MANQLPEGVKSQDVIFVDKDGNAVNSAKEADRIEVVRTMDDGTMTHTLLQTTKKKSS